jgi:hypothetical protein
MAERERHPGGSQSGMTPEEELDHAYGQALLTALTQAYADWREAHSRKISQAEVAQAVLYFAGGVLAELGLAAHLPAKGRWEDFVRDSQARLGEALAYCRASLERHARGGEP